MGFGDSKIKELGLELAKACKDKSTEHFEKGQKETENKELRAMHVTVAIMLAEMGAIISGVTSG